MQKSDDSVHKSTQKGQFPYKNAPKKGGKRTAPLDSVKKNALQHAPVLPHAPVRPRGRIDLCVRITCAVDHPVDVVLVVNGYVSVPPLPHDGHPEPYPPVDGRERDPLLRGKLLGRVVGNKLLVDSNKKEAKMSKELILFILNVVIELLKYILG